MLGMSRHWRRNIFRNILLRHLKRKFASSLERFTSAKATFRMLKRSSNWLERKTRTRLLLKPRSFLRVRLLARV
jgi:hypothetical protein